MWRGWPLREIPSLEGGGVSRLSPRASIHSSVCREVGFCRLTNPLMIRRGNDDWARGLDGRSRSERGD